MYAIFYSKYEKETYVQNRRNKYADVKISALRKIIC